MIDFLPEDLVIGILSRLHVKSATRFKSVCKSWCTLLSDPKFIYKNLLFSCEDDEKINNNHHLLINRRDNVSKRHVFSFLSYDPKLDIYSLTPALPRYTIYRQTEVDIVGSCSSLVCFRIPDNERVLWNPTTNIETKFVRLLRPHLPNFSSVELVSCIGFGFDSKTNDHKIIRVVRIWYHTYLTDLYRWIFKRRYEVEIFSLGKNSWKTVDVTMPGTTKLVPNFYPFNKFSSKNGSCHWTGKGEDGYPVVLSFDFSSETFRTTPPPDQCIISGNHHDVHDNIFMLKQFIAMLLPAGEVENYFDIWVLLELGVKESWIKLFNIGPLFGLGKPLGFWRNSDLMAETSDGQMLIYDPITQEIRGTVQVDGLPGSLRLVPYGVSQVSMEGGDQSNHNL